MDIVSVIIPIFNAEKSLEKCLESVRNQTYQNLEIIMVNDGSTDSSLAICEQMQLKDSRIKIINKKNAGVSAARNDGLEFSSGDYIVFVDSDDYIDYDMIKTMHKNSKDYNADIVECGYATVIDRTIQKKYSFKFENNKEALASLVSFISGKNGADSICNKMFKSQVVSSIRFEKYKFSEDFLFNVRAILNAKTKVTIEKVFYYYDISGEDSATQQKISERNLEDIKIRENLINEFYNSNFPPIIIQYLYTSILKKIIFLDIRVIKTNKYLPEIQQFLNYKFKKYYRSAKFKYVKEIQPKKVFYSILLRKFSPKLYKKVLKKYFLN